MRGGRLAENPNGMSALIFFITFHLAIILAISTNFIYGLGKFRDFNGRAIGAFCLTCLSLVQKKTVVTGTGQSYCNKQAGLQ